ncbi:MAG: hydrogenase maturation protease [Gammaproteobacteria bacterium]|nr:hydrogenase maturation protease [Gammaproteobacteria bacterium]
MGSPLGVDAVGWHAVEAVRQASPVLRGCERLEVLVLDRPGAALIEALRGAELVVLVDAMRAGGPPAQVRRLSPDTLATGAFTSSHGIGVAEALALARALGELPPRLAVLGIEVGDGTAEVGRLLATAGHALRAEVEAEIEACAAALEAGRPERPPDD